MFKRIVVIVVLVLAAVVSYEWITMPDVSRLADDWPKTTAFMEQRKAELRREGKDDTLDYRPVPYTRISPYLRRAVLVSEDNDFYEHNGVDVKALKEAIQRDWTHKKLMRGGSTITQQLAKNLYLSSSRNPLRKLKEYFIARRLEDRLTKKRILELYLNVVEMGERVYGAEAAARTYFHEPAAALNPSQAALLAGCLPNPRLMNPASPNRRLRARQHIILSRLRRWGYIYEEEVLTAKKPPAAKTPEPPAADTAPLKQTPPSDSASPPPEQTTQTAATTETTDTTATTTAPP